MLRRRSPSFRLRSGDLSSGAAAPQTSLHILGASAPQTSRLPRSSSDPPDPPLAAAAPQAPRFLLGGSARQTHQRRTRSILRRLKQTTYIITNTYQ